MSIFADEKTMRIIFGLSSEARYHSTQELFDKIGNSCSDPNPLKAVLDRIVSGDRITNNIDNIMKNKSSTPIINTYPYGTPANDIFPYMHAVFRYGKNPTSFANALSRYAHSANTVGSDEKTILITTDFCNPEFIDEIENALVDVYFTGKLTVIIALFTDYGCSDIPFYMNYRWSGSYPKLMDRSDIIAKLGSPIIYEEQEYSFCSPGKTRSYTITINSVKDTQITNNMTHKTKIVKGHNAKRFIENLWLFSENAPQKIGSYAMDITTYNISFANRDYQGLFPCDDESKELIGIFENLIGNF